MFHTATHIAHRGATLVLREELHRYEPPDATKSWKPVKHALIVDLMHEELERPHIQVAKEEYAVQREGSYLFAALTLSWLETEEFIAALAFRHANDNSEAMKMYASVRVFVCDNMALSGDEIILNRKHTTRLNVAAELSKAFGRYKDGALVLQRNIFPSSVPLPFLLLIPSRPARMARQAERPRHARSPARTDGGQAQRTRHPGSASEASTATWRHQA